MLGIIALVLGVAGALQFNGVCLSQGRVIPDKELIEALVKRDSGHAVCEQDPPPARGGRCGSRIAARFPDIADGWTQYLSNPGCCEASSFILAAETTGIHIETLGKILGTQWRFVSVGRVQTTVDLATGNRSSRTSGETHVVNQCGNATRFHDWLVNNLWR
jgi:hypothetical protein